MVEYNNNKTWGNLARTPVRFSVVDRGVNGLSTSSNVIQRDDGTEGNATAGVSVSELSNPLYCLPSDVRDNVAEEYYETGYCSLLQKHFLNIIEKNGNGDELQEIMNDLYMYATRIGSHILSHNVILTLSQLPLRDLGSWANTLAVAATRSRFADVQELGIRCFENWEDRESCQFLRGCKFSERWLQDYADEVCSDVLERNANNVLFA